MKLLDSSYAVKAIKQRSGLEGDDGFTANLYKGSKKVAELLEDANGGGLIIYWQDESSPEVLGDVMNAFDKVHQRDMTPSEAELAAYLLKTQGTDPRLNSDADMTIWLVNLTQYTDLVRQAKRELKSATFYHPETHEVVAYKVPYDEQYKDILDKQIAEDYPGYLNVNELDLEKATIILNYGFFESRKASKQSIIDSVNGLPPKPVPKF